MNAIIQICNNASETAAGSISQDRESLAMPPIQSRKRSHTTSTQALASTRKAGLPSIKELIELDHQRILAHRHKQVERVKDHLPEK